MQPLYNKVLLPDEEIFRVLGASREEAACTTNILMQPLYNKILLPDEEILEYWVQAERRWSVQPKHIDAAFV